MKDLCDLAKLNTSVKKVAFFGAERKETIQKKAEAITFHAGRKTFITLYLLSGGNREQAKKLTGIKDYSTMERYINVDMKEASKRMNEIFTPVLKKVANQ